MHVFMSGRLELRAIYPRILSIKKRKKKKTLSGVSNSPMSNTPATLFRYKSRNCAQCC